MHAHANILSASVVPSPPSRIGRYEVKSPIGRGGMGNLYLAHDPGTDRLVAIKLLDASLNTPEFRQRFVLEAKALAAVNHPHIVDIYDTGEYEGTPYFVMEYVRGETLAEIIRRRADTPITQRLRWMTELCAGLSGAHDANIIHRDIKPANLILDRQGKLKILDFGIARVDAHASAASMRLTQVDTAIGTPGYMSPEQLEGREIDHRSDLFSAGAVCYELFTYTEAFPGGTSREIEAQIKKCRPEPLTAVAPGLDPEFDEIVLRALKRDPNKRYQDASTFERDLERLRAKLGASETPIPSRPTPPPPTGRGKTRELRAEAAYQRALAAYRNGETEESRQCSVEALAEDPSHKEARALLAGLAPAQSRRRPLPSTAVPAPSLATVVSTTLEPTQVVDPYATRAAEETAVQHARRQSDPTQIAQGRFDTISGAQTVIVQPRPSARRDADTAAAAPSPGKRGPAARRPGTETSRPQVAAIGALASSLATRAGTLVQGGRAGILLVIAAIAVVLLAVAVVRLLPSMWTSAGPLLTITKPENGTLVADGIRCGSRGEDCTATLKDDQTIEVMPLADEGFVFSGYHGDCAPTGRLQMNGPRTCGATFMQVDPGRWTSAPTPTPMQVMTIAPVPQGGTVEGVGIKCGTQGSVCTTEYPQGELAVFKAIADEGHTFMGFTGECGPTGQTEMSIARTCGARFEDKTKLVATTPNATVPLPPNRGGQRGRDRATPGNAPGPSTPEGTTAGATAAPKPDAPAIPPPEQTASSGSQTSPSTPQPGVSEDKTPPQTPEAFAKDRIKELFARWCEAYVAIDPAAVQQVFPRVDMTSLKLQLNSDQYKSVQCSTGDLNYSAIDPAAGKASLKTDVTWVFAHTVTNKKEYKLIGTFTLVRPKDRTGWIIESARFQPK